MKVSQSLRLLALLGAALALSACGLGDVAFTITFQDAKGLAPGDPVVHTGVVIGRVIAIDEGDRGGVRVRVKVDADRKSAVDREARFVIDKAPITPGHAGGRQITVHDPGGESRTPIANGDVVEGSEGSLDDLLRALNRAGDSAAKAARRLADEVNQALKDARESPEAQQLERDLDDFARQAERVGRDGWDDLRRNHLPQLEEEVRRLRRQLEQAGKSEEAQKLRERFERWRREIERDATDQDE